MVAQSWEIFLETAEQWRVERVTLASNTGDSGRPDAQLLVYVHGTPSEQDLAMRDVLSRISERHTVDSSQCPWRFEARCCQTRLI
jgi:hypothetical protein